MPGPYPLDSLSVAIDVDGITAPDYSDILLSLQASYRQIYGSDIYLAPDSQDGQWLAIQAQAIHNANQALILGYFAYSPRTSMGIGLSSVVKINGIERLAPSQSTVDLLLGGVSGTEIINGTVQSNDSSTAWILPPRVVIPATGEILATAYCSTLGAITAPANTVNVIVATQPGWQTANNQEAAFPGLPVEYDVELRRRQAISTSLPAITPRESIQAAVANQRGVGRCYVHDNDSDFYDAELVPPHSIAVIVEGGGVEDIAYAIARKKNTGCGTYGTSQYTTYDVHGVPLTVNWFYLAEVPIYATVVIEPLPGWLGSTAQLIIDSVAFAIQDSQIGENVYETKLYSPANLQGTEAETATGLADYQLNKLTQSYIVRQIYIGTVPYPTNTTDIPIPYNAAASCNISQVIIQITETIDGVSRITSTTYHVNAGAY